MNGEARSLYVHFPFCETKCHYCDFYSLAAHRVKKEDQLKFESALSKECLMQNSLLSSTLDTIFFGGGTPSLTLLSTIEKVCKNLNLADRITPQTEWTLEANPSSVAKENTLFYKRLGVNRISLGVQSLQNSVLKKMDRAHDQKKAYAALDIIFENFSNVSVDLLCGVPGQSLIDLEWNLDQLTQYPITHLSCYLLTLPPHHKMAKELPSENEQVAQLLFIHDYMDAKGFERYEISNFSKPNFKAQHNLNYWHKKSYLGLGPSAHSFLQTKNKRWKNISSLRKYTEILSKEARLPIEWEEVLTDEQNKIECWMLSLRLAEGFPKKWIYTENQKKKCDLFLKKNWIRAHPTQPTHYQLTPLGLCLSDTVIKELMD